MCSQIWGAILGVGEEISLLDLSLGLRLFSAVFDAGKVAVVRLCMPWAVPRTDVYTISAPDSRRRVSFSVDASHQSADLKVFCVHFASSCRMTSLNRPTDRMMTTIIQTFIRQHSRDQRFITGWLIKNVPNFAMMLYCSTIEFKQKEITF